MKYEIKNRWTQQVQFIAEIECDESASWSFMLGLAVRVAIRAGADLRGADLSSANLSSANLSGADLSSAYLSGANLRRANLGGAYLRGADLSGAYLRDANLRGANLGGADLGGADLRDANLRDANLGGANLGGAYLGGAYLWGANLGGLTLLARATRSDGFEYFAWTSILGGMVITAGCRTWIGKDAIQQARAHCQTKTAERCRKEALSIVDHIERMAE